MRDKPERQATPEEWKRLCVGIRNPRTRRHFESGLARSITDRGGVKWVAPNYIEANAKFESMTADEQRELLLHKDTLNGRDQNFAPKVEKFS